MASRLSLLGSLALELRVFASGGSGLAFVWAWTSGFAVVSLAVVWVVVVATMAEAGPSRMASFEAVFGPIFEVVFGVAWSVTCVGLVVDGTDPLKTPLALGRQAHRVSGAMV